jgi:hypothetical protein
MSSKNLSRRLERLEAELAPDVNPQVLTITVTRIGEPDRTIELQLKKPTRRRRPWRRNGGQGR